MPRANDCHCLTRLPLGQIVGSDLFHQKGTTYLLIVDYFSRYPEIVKLTDTTSKGLVAALRPIFARHDVPAVLHSDNGPQYVSREMSEFATLYGFTQVTNSPNYPRSNGLAERTVKTAKAMLEKSSDLYLALLSYRSTELSWCESFSIVYGAKDQEYPTRSATESITSVATVQRIRQDIQRETKTILRQET